MQETTFWKLITSTDIRRICIPTIQRDYAQGRRDKVYIRKNFLEALKSAIEDSDKQLMLDFVYGIENESIFVPLDGQQRLTTLWLLHWYIAYKSEHLNDADVKNALLKFTYETRVSSSDFCKLLCGLWPLPNHMSMRDWITQQTWFYHQYNQDPTIMGMLNTIAGTDILDEDGKDVVDGLEKLFKEEDVDYYQSMWTTLTTTDCIKFNKLHISQYDSDELYVKMNARGKQLTDFENFKAELVRYVQKILGEKNAVDFAAKLDVDWTDIFWDNKWKDEQTGDVSIDEIYFAFVRRFVRLECINKQGEKSALLNRISRTFTCFNPYKEVIDAKSINDFVTLMDNLSDCIKGLSSNKLDTISPWGEEFDFIPKYKSKNDITTTTNTQLLLFYGYCRYFLIGKYNEKSFLDWNRVLWNICENRVEKSSYKPTMKEIDLLATHSHNILSYLSQNEDIKFDANKEQLLEEQRKARHLSDFPNIIEMEGYAFFKGAIRFLYTGDDNNEDWDNFNKKAENVKTLVPKKREERHTIKLLTRYVPEESLPITYSQSHWAKNTDEDLRRILLDDRLSKFIHNFLLQNGKTHSSLLHKDILELCENEISRDAYIQTEWPDSKYVWTNYSRASGYYHWNSFVIGNEDFKQVSRVIRESKKFEIQKEQSQSERWCGDIIQGLYLHFKYEEFYFTLFGDNTVCRMTEQWREKFPNPIDLKGFYFAIKGINNDDDLIKQIGNIIKSEKD